jgi:hypothetical protein
MGIANDVQKAGVPRATNLGNMVDESPSDAALPEERFHEQRIQLRPAVWAWQHRGKTRDDTVAFCDEDAAFRNLRDRQLDCVGVREKRVAISGIVERRTALQRLEQRLLVRTCLADGNILHHFEPSAERPLADRHDDLDAGLSQNTGT